MSLVEYREPTHVVHIEVPLWLDDRPPMHDFNPIQDVITLALSISRAAFVRAICGEPQVTLIEWSKARDEEGRP